MYWLDKILYKPKGYQHHFPYAHDVVIRREQMLENLSKGVHMEDLNLFIEWNTPLRNLQRYVRQKLKQKSYVDDGRHVILDGLEVFLDPHRNMMNTLPFIDLSSSLGFDDKGHKRYLEIHKHLTDRFGPPTDLEDFLPYDFHGVRTAIWKHRSFQVGLYVWERFAVHFELRIEYLPNQH